MMGRLAPGVTIEQARAVLSQIEAQSIREHLKGIQLSRFEEDLRQSPVEVQRGSRGFSRHRAMYRQALIVLMAAVALVMLVVCANVANLMLARAIGRGREMTMRMTLGAGRGRLVQQLLIESTLLALVAAALGLVGALWGSEVLLRVVGAQADLPVTLDVRPDWSLIGFIAAATLACVMLFGLVPAFRVTRVDLATALRGWGRSVGGASPRPGRVPISRVLVVSQVALSMILLMGSGLLVRSMSELLRTDLGMDRDHLVIAHVAMSRSSYAGERLLAFQRQLLDRVRQLPGVDAASYSLGGAFSGGRSSGHVTIPGFVARADSESEAYYDYIGPEYFRALGARLLRGRDFSTSDIDGRAKIAAINATMAKFYFRDRDPISRTVTIDSVDYTIVGVVADVQVSDLRDPPARRLYVPFPGSGDQPRSFEVAIHVRGRPAQYVEAIRRATSDVDRSIPIEVTPLLERVKHSVSRDALLMQVTTFFGGLALLLAALGLYGVTAYATTQRAGEFGLRTALGAESWRVAALVVREALTVALWGVAMGVPLGFAATRLLRGALFGVSSFDPLSLGAAVATLVLTAVMASYVPAWRATRVSPLEALRVDR
jgi:predicted permease